MERIVSAFTEESVGFQPPSLLGLMQEVDMAFLCVDTIFMQIMQMYHHIGHTWPDALRLYLGMT